MGFFRIEGVGFIRVVGFKCVGCKVRVRGVGGGGEGGEEGSKDRGEVRGPAHIKTSSKCTLLCRGG